MSFPPHSAVHRHQHERKPIDFSLLGSDLLSEAGKGRGAAASYILQPPRATYSMERGAPGHAAEVGP